MFVAPDALMAPLQAHSGEEAVEELLMALHNSQRIPEAPIPNARQAAGAGPVTFCGGIAITSIRIPSLDRVVVALGTCPRGVRFVSNPQDEASVVLLAAWGDASESDLPGRREALVDLTADPGFQRAILTATSAEEAAACFPSAPAGHYRTVFTRHYAPLVPELVYVTD
ncbi:MAG TPA: hypothetical protein VFH83_12930 [Spirochaetia bacterium]|nr:hypothetical protein [Spirochaetia bacterium]